MPMANKLARSRHPALAGQHDHVPPRTPERPGERVAADLRRRIESGEWASGDLMPTVAALGEHYGVSKATAAKALRTLADENLVVIISRWGTFRA